VVGTQPCDFAAGDMFSAFMPIESQKIGEKISVEQFPLPHDRHQLQSAECKSFGIPHMMRASTLDWLMLI
jgi:hypothetical protein